MLSASSRRKTIIPLISRKPVTSHLTRVHTVSPRPQFSHQVRQRPFSLLHFHFYTPSLLHLLALLSALSAFSLPLSAHTIPHNLPTHNLLLTQPTMLPPHRRVDLCGPLRIAWLPFPSSTDFLVRPQPTWSHFPNQSSQWSFTSEAQRF